MDCTCSACVEASIWSGDERPCAESVHRAPRSWEAATGGIVSEFVAAHRRDVSVSPVAVTSPLGPEWQSGERYEYASLTLRTLLGELAREGIAVPRIADPRGPRCPACGRRDVFDDDCADCGVPLTPRDMGDELQSEAAE